MANKFNIVIDFDSTFIKGEALEKLAEISLIDNPRKQDILARIKTITDLGMNGKIPFGESLKKRLELLAINRTDLNNLVSYLKKTVTRSLIDNKRFFRLNKNCIFIISGGFLEYIWPVVRDYGLKKSNILANRFIFNGRGEVVGYDRLNPLSQARGKALKVKSLGLKGDLYIIGDGYTDYEIKKYHVPSYFFVFTENIRREAVASLGDFVVGDFAQFINIFSHGIKRGNK